MNGIKYDALRNAQRRRNLAWLQVRYEQAARLNGPAMGLRRTNQHGELVVLRVLPTAKYEVVVRGVAHGYSKPEKALSAYEVA